MIPMDWIMGLIGGLMIGSAAAVYLLISGRIMGASGILGGIVDGSGRDSLIERIVFVVGLTGAAFVGTRLYPTLAETNVTWNPALLILGGIAVGVGTRLANGCTSGHGVCGISRFSMRGIVATLAYLGFGFVTMYVGRHVMGVI